MMRPTGLLLALFVSAGCAAGPVAAPPTRPASAQVRARLMHLERAVPGASVSAVRNPGVTFREERVSATAESDGRAFLTLSPGSWYIAAAAAEPALFGWSGSNPVTLRPGEIVDIAIPSVPVPPPADVSPASPGTEALAGEVIGEGGPVAGAAVALYLDAATEFRGPGYLEARTDAEGRFEVRLTPGRYWLLARRRAGPEAFGPLEAGDDFGFYAQNPLVVATGTRVTVRIGAVRVLKKSGWSAPSLLRTRVSGRVRDPAGRPLAGYRAFLHESSAMLGKPAFVSEPTGPDGVYTIWADREGRFYLGARAAIGRAREATDRVGLYRGTADHAVNIRLEAGELRGLDVVLGPEDGPR